MIHFACDGTIRGDWASHYAFRLATREASRTLRVIHLDEGHLPRCELDARLIKFERRGRDLGLQVRAEARPLASNVIQTPDGACPGGYVFPGWGTGRTWVLPGHMTTL